MADDARAVAGLLLTGGSSRRMGRDKAGIVLGGVTLADRGAATLGAACAPCLEVGPGASILPSVQEVPPGGGPLAGMVAGWHALRIEHGHDGPVLVLACDMPRVTEELLRFLAGAGGDPDANADPDDSVIPESRGRLQPLCARYSASALATADRLVTDGERSMQALIGAIPFRRVAESDWGRVAPPDAFDDLDAPDDLGRLGGAG